ncbi:GTP-binding protein YchF [Mycoplasmoides fastidiosum]|uniref:Ribosome-binding ATPase YchF n=1 Tax=Mycoplasmoides fastidiosum TaxID=92758 RepID=A0ABU0LYA9_9BACT|nr:redox-regulated ATPase YchF [Mycoplasmoides fastidiosum]MDQ0513697.1 GTP-binding protein YchF [Mycoplasmoides fastidiosum]UUD37880.1 redox-regulated ATPase YchF [Mycoplasmoides fastidiosum]
MALSAGIVGLPNVGKSTLFNTITKLSILVENYPFATIEPNVGVVNLVDERLTKLAQIIEPNKITYATFKFVDIAGLVKGASKGEGLGNKFLQNIRDVDAICHVVRCFDDKTILSTSDQLDAVTDAQVIDLELIYADLEVVKKALHNLPKKMGQKLTNQVDAWDLLERIKQFLDQEKPIRLMEFNEHELTFLKSYNFLTQKPMLYIGNVNDNDIANPEANEQFQKLLAYAQSLNANAIALSVKLENELSQLDPNDATEMMNELGMQETGLNKVIGASFKLLNLSTYFTFGKTEVRAWPFRNGLKAPQCAGIIHSDFERGFIRAEIMRYDDLIHYGSESGVKENGKMRSEGKEYLMQDGDVCLFKFNV